MNPSLPQEPNQTGPSVREAGPRGERPDLQADLLGLMTAAVHATALTESDLRRLLRQGPQLATSLQTLLSRCSGAARLQCVDCPNFPLDLTTSLTVLAALCGGDVGQSLNAALFTDPPLAPTPQYQLVSFQHELAGREAVVELPWLGLRAATLREALCLLDTAPDVLRPSRRFILLGSARAGVSDTHPCLTRSRQQLRITHIAQRQALRPGTYHLLVARHSEQTAFGTTGF